MRLNPDAPDAKAMTYKDPGVTLIAMTYKDLAVDHARLAATKVV